MSRARLRFLPEARDEILSARRWYEAQARGLGRAFLGELDALAALLLDHPEMFPIVMEASGVRRAVLHRFPYLILYRVIAPDDILVLRCRHVRQDDVGQV